MTARQVVSLTLAEATALGIVTCKHCGLPRNNHFSFGKKICAHRPCPGWSPKFTRGTPINNTVKKRTAKRK